MPVPIQPSKYFPAPFGSKLSALSFSMLLLDAVLPEKSLKKTAVGLLGKSFNAVCKSRPKFTISSCCPDKRGPQATSKN